MNDLINIIVNLFIKVPFYMCQTIFYSILLIISVTYEISTGKYKKKMTHDQSKAYVLNQNRKGKRLDKNLTNKQVIKQVWGY